MRNTWNKANLRGIQKKKVLSSSLQLVTGSSEIKKGSLVNDNAPDGRRDLKFFWSFEKWQMLKFKVVYSTKISLTFWAIKKNNRPKKNPSSIRRTIIYRISEKNFKLIGQAVLKLQWSPTSKTWFEKNAFKVSSTICMHIETASFKVIYFHK